MREVVTSDCRTSGCQTVALQSMFQTSTAARNEAASPTAQVALLRNRVCWPLNGVLLRILCTPHERRLSQQHLCTLYAGEATSVGAAYLASEHQLHLAAFNAGSSGGSGGGNGIESQQGIDPHSQGAPIEGRQGSGTGSSVCYPQQHAVSLHAKARAAQRQLYSQLFA